MKEQIIYSVRVASIEYGGLKIWHVKIGITSNIKQTLKGYSRSNMEASLLDLWHANSDLDSLSCERGVQRIAERYAYKRESEKFIFLQDSYKDFKDNVILLLKETSEDILLSSDNGTPTTRNKKEKKTQRKGFSIGSDSYSIAKSYEILTNTAEWLIAKGKLKETDCPIPTGRIRNLVHTTPTHQHKDFVAPKKLSNGLYIETHFSTVDCIKNAKRLLENCGYNGDLLKA